MKDRNIETKADIREDTLWYESMGFFDSIFLIITSRQCKRQKGYIQ